MKSQDIKRGIQRNEIVHHLDKPRNPRFVGQLHPAAPTLQKKAGPHSGAVRFPARMEQRGHDHSRIVARNYRANLPPKEQ